MTGSKYEMQQLLRTLSRGKWWILLLALVGIGVAVASVSYMVKPKYQSNTTMMVYSRKALLTTDIAEQFDLDSLLANQKLVCTYCEIVKSRIVLEQVIERLNLNMSYEMLLSKTSAQPVGTTEILRVTVDDGNPKRAAEIANAIADVFTQEVIRILDVDNVNRIDKAIPILRPVNLRPLMMAAVGGVVGAAMGVLIIFAWEVLDPNLRSPEDVVRHLGIPVLGVVPNIKL